MRFDVPALKNVIAKQVGHGNVKSIVILSEGGFNRVLLATMEDGFRVIIKIPYWISGPKTYATATEFAALTFLRSKGLPVPGVYGWSSTTEMQLALNILSWNMHQGLVWILVGSTRHNTRKWPW
jgi:cysteinyl-tRNA synthetase